MELGLGHRLDEAAPARPAGRSGVGHPPMLRCRPPDRRTATDAAGGRPDSHRRQAPTGRAGPRLAARGRRHRARCRRPRRGHGHARGRRQRPSGSRRAGRRRRRPRRSTRSRRTCARCPTTIGALGQQAASLSRRCRATTPTPVDAAIAEGDGAASTASRRGPRAIRDAAGRGPARRIAGRGVRAVAGRRRPSRRDLGALDTTDGLGGRVDPAHGRLAGAPAGCRGCSPPTTRPSSRRPRPGATPTTTTALEQLDEADAAIAEATTLRDRLAATVDVTTLDEWLDRSGAYDVALRDLYAAVQRVDGTGRPTSPRARCAAEAARARRACHPTRALVLIMSEIGRGGMNGAVIAIEEAPATTSTRPLAPPLDRDPAP